MYQITANEKGSREITVTDEHLATIKEYSLFTDLVSSHGIVSEDTLAKLQMNVRSLMESNPQEERLISLCRDVLFHKDMKAFGLHQLITLFLHKVNE